MPTDSALKPSSSRGSIVFSVLLGALPWVAAAVLASVGFPRLAVLLRLALALLLVSRGLWRRSLKALDATTLLYAIGEIILTFGFGMWWILRYGGVTSQGAMALMAVLSVALGSPFTFQYAREAWSRDYWDNRIFRKTNAIISLAFGGSFALGAIASAVALLVPSLPEVGRVALGSIAPPLLGIGMGVLSAGISKRYPRYALARELARRQGPSWSIPRVPRPPSEAEADVIVVGAGIGGLSAAALLAQRGLRVLVLEQHALPGGCSSSFPRRTKAGNFVFDVGVHDISGLGPRGPVRNLLSELGLTAELRLLRVTQRLDMDGIAFDIPHETAELARKLGEHFPQESEAIGRIFDELLSFYRELYADIERHGGVPSAPTSVDEMLEFPRLHPTMQRWMDKPFSDFVRSFSSDESLLRVIRSISSYLTDDPSRLRVLEMAPLFGYFFDGGFYPEGGSQALAEKLVSVIVQHGGAVRLRTPVRRIVVSGGAVTGVEIKDGKLLRAPIVVSNADVRRTFFELLDAPSAELRDRCRDLRPGPSAVACFLGLDFVPDLPPIVRCRRDGKPVGIAIPSLLDPSLAPPGHSAVTLLSLVSAAEAASFDRTAPDYAERKRALGDELIRRAEDVLGPLSSHIVHREDATPATFQRYLWSTGGSIYGMDRSCLRESVKSLVPGLFLVGAGVSPGSGIEAVVISGTRAANTICPSSNRLIATQIE